MRLTSDLPDFPTAPLGEVLIACEIDVGPASAPAWEPRTYHVTYQGDGTYLVGLGDRDNPRERFNSWARVANWFAFLRPRNIEVLIEDRPRRTS